MVAEESLTKKYDPVEPTGRSFAYIDKLAGQLARKLGYGAGKDLIAVVQRLGGQIFVHPWRNPDEDGSIEVRGPGNFTVYLSPFTGQLRDRFTIAHELGHYFLHSLVGKKRIRIAREGSNPAEWEANCFAAGFLMPKEEFITKAKEVGWDVQKLAAHFVVSSQVAALRVKNLRNGV